MNEKYELIRVYVDDLTDVILIVGANEQPDYISRKLYHGKIDLCNDRNSQLSFYGEFNNYNELLKLLLKYYGAKNYEIYNK